MQCTVHSVALQTASFEEAFDFYTSVLGLRVAREPFFFKTRRLAWLDGGSVLIELYSGKEGVALGDHSQAHVGPDHIAFTVDDLDSMVEHLKSNGVTIIKGPYVPPSGDPAQPRVVFAEGPDGEEIQFREAMPRQQL
jgi:catechol 2,3-dioxygenase-like lactoylglutathione lyase family enzyme